MDISSAIKLTSAAARALYPLSPERVNAGRITPTMAATCTVNAEHGKLPELDSEQTPFQSPQTSPSRRHKDAVFGGSHAPATPTDKISGFPVPQSPSLPEIHALRSHLRANSDVQGLVQRFEHLEVRDRDAESAERRKKQEAELRRAQMAREEAESDVKRLREETRRLKKERDEGLERERKVSKRLEVVMEEFAASKESSASQMNVYEKELRKVRKEAFKSSSALVKLQEELKSSRATLRVTHSALELEKQKLQRKEQERFEMEYQLIPLQEQVEKLRQQLSITEREKEALKQNVREDDVERIAADGLIALPCPQEDDSLCSPMRSPPKRPRSPFSDDKENFQALPRKNIEIKRLTQQLGTERLLRERAEGLAEFMRIECMFNCCACTKTNRRSHQARPDLGSDMSARFEEVQSDMFRFIGNASDVKTIELVGLQNSDDMVVEIERGTHPSPIALEEIIETKADSILEHEIHEVAMAPAAANDDCSITMVPGGMDIDCAAQLSGGGEQDFQPIFQRQDVKQIVISEPDTPSSRTSQLVPSTESVLTIPLRPETPPNSHRGTPFRHQPSVRTVTTTTTVPMQFTPVSKPSSHQAAALATNADAGTDPAECSILNSVATQNDTVETAPTFDRAAALAAIEYRRGRARSFAAGLATPRKQMVEGIRERRDISAPTFGQKTVGGVSNSTAPSASVVRSRSVGRPNRR